MYAHRKTGGTPPPAVPSNGKNPPTIRNFLRKDNEGSGNAADQVTRLITVFRPAGS